MLSVPIVRQKKKPPIAKSLFIVTPAICVPGVPKAHDCIAKVNNEIVNISPNLCIESNGRYG